MVTLRTSSYHIFPTSLTTVEPWNHVVKSQRTLDFTLMLATVLAAVIIAQHDVVSAELDPAGYLDIITKQQDCWNINGRGRAVDLPVFIMSQNLSVL
jgi:hypothetical protein